MARKKKLKTVRLPREERPEPKVEVVKTYPVYVEEGIRLPGINSQAAMCADHQRRHGWGYAGKKPVTLLASGEMYFEMGGKKWTVETGDDGYLWVVGQKTSNRRQGRHNVVREAEELVESMFSGEMI